ncbi:MAG: ABC transporter permease subunit [Chloroflexota bacterium]
MRNAWIVAKRELGSIFVQPIAYIFAIVMVSITGYLFAAQLGATLLQPGGAPVDLGIMRTFAFLFVFAAPAITMRLLSEEQRSGTMELLMTMPVRDGEVVFGKYLAALIFFIATTALTLIFPLILFNYGNPDAGPILTIYLGIILYGSALISIGLLASALSENQMVSFILAFGLILVLFLAFIPAQIFPDNQSLVAVFTELAFDRHLDSFQRGLLVAKDIAYYLVITAGFLFAAARVLESRRWR